MCRPRLHRRLAFVSDRLEDRTLLRELEPVLQEVVVTANSSPRSMDADELGVGPTTSPAAVAFTARGHTLARATLTATYSR